MAYRSSYGNLCLLMAYQHQPASESIEEGQRRDNDVALNECGFHN
jgi:hypothetical protein